ncbi:MAG TPA: FecR domain-containing protein [Polyangiaceae bacterium]
MTFEKHDAVERALENLGRVAVPVEESSSSSVRRDRVVGALGSVLGRVRARRTFVRRAWITMFSVMSVGAVALGGIAVVKLKEPPAVARLAEPEAWRTRSVVGTVLVRGADGLERSVTSGEVLRGGDILETRAGASVAFGLSSGDVRLGGVSRIGVVSTSSAERRLRVAMGAVEVDLPKKLPHGQALILETPDAHVRVVGTAFRVQVDVDATGKSATEVSVQRGTVWVSQNGVRRATLGAGSKWRSPSETPVAAAVPPERREPARVVASTPVQRSARAPEVQGTLAEENRLYEAALASRNAGDDRRAAEGFAQLLARYPRSVLVEQSLAERFRALDRAGQVSLAVAAARRYLAAYPEGFARADAERIVRR